MGKTGFFHPDSVLLFKYNCYLAIVFFKRKKVLKAKLGFHTGTRKNIQSRKRKRK